MNVIRWGLRAFLLGLHLIGGFALAGSIGFSGTVDDNRATLDHFDKSYSGLFTIDSIKRRLDGKELIAIGPRAFKGCSRMTGIMVPPTVELIGQSAFEVCDSLSLVVIPNRVKSIGNAAFFSCVSLERVNVPYNVTNLGNAAFCQCVNLANAEIAGSGCEIGKYAFAACINLKNVTIRQGVVSIGEAAFNGCGSLSSVTIPASVANIGECAFAGCTSLTSVTICGNITNLGDFAFMDCANLKRVTFASRVAHVGRDPFSGCSGLSVENRPEWITRPKDEWANGDRGQEAKSLLDGEHLFATTGGCIAVTYTCTDCGSNHTGDVFKCVAMTDLDSYKRRALLGHALTKYPCGFVTSNVDRIFLERQIDVRSSTHSWKRDGGFASDRCFYVNCGEQPQGNRFVEEAVFHHEFCHILLQRHKSLFSKRDWLSANPDVFTYKRSLDNASPAPTTQYLYLAQGFVSDYGRTRWEEDVCTYAMWLFTRSDWMFKQADKHARVKAKLDMIIAFYSRLDPFFTEDSFRRRCRFNMTPPYMNEALHLSSGDYLTACD